MYHNAQYLLHSKKQMSIGGLSELTFFAQSSTMHLYLSFCSIHLSRKKHPFFNQGLHLAVLTPKYISPLQHSESYPTYPTSLFSFPYISITPSIHLKRPTRIIHALSLPILKHESTQIFVPPFLL